MKNFILIFAVLLALKTSADTIVTRTAYAKPCEQVSRTKIMALKDSLEKDSLMVFTIDNITYLDIDQLTLKKIINEISMNTTPTMENTVFYSRQTHYAYDEEKEKIYSGKTLYSIEEQFDGLLEITIFWVLPARNTERSQE